MRSARRRNGIVLAGAVVLLSALVGAHVVRVAQARSEVRMLVQLVRPAYTARDVSDLLAAHSWRHLTLGNAINGLIPVHSHPGWFPSQEWIVWISTVDGKATAVRVRLSDGTQWHPTCAPPDRIWGKEPHGSYFASQ